jgi:hypothetical protein
MVKGGSWAWPAWARPNNFFFSVKKKGNKKIRKGKKGNSLASLSRISLFDGATLCFSPLSTTTARLSASQSHHELLLSPRPATS